MDNLFTKVSISPLVISLMYYNPRVSRWEPVIEDIGLNIDYISSPFSKESAR